MKLAFLLVLGSISLTGAIVFPPNNLVSYNDCSFSLPRTLPDPQAQDLQRSFSLRTDSGSLTVFGLVQKNSFLRDSLLSANLTPAGADVNISINPNALNLGHNKAYIGFFTGGSTAFAGFVTIDVSCSPQPTISLKNDSLSVQTSQGSGSFSLLMPGEIKGANASLGYVKNPIQFTLTPDTQETGIPWIVSASVPGSPPNTGAVTPGGSQDLTVNLNPVGLAVQPNPYTGFVHITDNNTGFGSADLTVQLTVSAAITGNATLPHFAANGPLITGFYIVNTAAQNATFSLAFIDESGKPVSVPVTGQGNVNTVSGTLLPNGSTYFEAGDPNLNNSLSGSVRITADASVGVQALFRLRRQQTQGVNFYEAAVAPTTGSKEFVIPFDATVFAPTGEQIFTGIAIANLDTANPAIVNCVARDGSGAVIPNAVTVPNLPPGGHWADFNFPPLQGKRGTLDCTGSTTIGSIALHAFANGAVSSLPVLLK